MVSTSEFKKGIFIEVDGNPFEITEFQHVKPGKGNAFVKTRMKNLLLGTVLERNFRSGEKFPEADVSRKVHQYLYRDGNGFQFLDMESFEQLLVEESVVGDALQFLVENLEVDIISYNGRPVSVSLPNFVELEVTYCEPALKGDTASGGGKPATVSTGMTVTVPFHIKHGDVLKIDTRTSAYVEKVK